MAEHEGGSIKASSLCAVEAAKFVSKDNPVSLLLAGSGSSLQKAAARAASCHPSISQVLPVPCLIFFPLVTYVSYSVGLLWLIVEGHSIMINWL